MRALADYDVTSGLVRESIDSLNLLGIYNSLTMGCVPGHEWHEDNERVDCLVPRPFRFLNLLWCTNRLSYGDSSRMGKVKSCGPLGSIDWTAKVVYIFFRCEIKEILVERRSEERYELPYRTLQT